jgi:hypothetical protein
MRTASYQIQINEKNLDITVKHLKTSVNYYEEMRKKGKIDYNTLTHLQDDTLSVFLWVEKYLLLQLMRDGEEIPYEKSEPRTNVDLG